MSMVAPTVVSSLELAGTPHDADAFVIQAHRYRRRLLRLAYRITGNLEDAEDVVQETMCRLWTRSHQFERRSEFASWLTRISINEALTCLRRRRHLRFVSIDDNDENKPSIELSDSRPNSEDEYISNEMSMRLRNSVSRLPSLYKEVVILYHQEGLSIGDIAEKLSIGDSAIKSRLVRARLVLRENLSKQHYVVSAT